MAHEMSLTKLSAIVIGAGFGGLSASIELASRGAKVQVFEAYETLKRQGRPRFRWSRWSLSKITNNQEGDVIQVPANATRLMSRWGDVLQKVTTLSSSPNIMTILNKDGKVLLDQELFTEFDGFPNIYGHRGRIQRMLYDYAVSLGVEVHFGATVTNLIETEDSAGVVVDGTEYKADLVIAADGVHSKARRHVVGTVERPKKSGFAVYRSWFPLQLLKDDPLTADIAKSETPLFKIWIAEDTHGILTTNPALQSATCFVTHKASISHLKPT